MNISKTTRRVRNTLVMTATLSAGMLGAPVQAQELHNPAIAMTNEAMVATGACVAKYVGRFDNVSLQPEVVGRRVAVRCQQLIARSVGLATLMSGRPDDYAKNLEYINAVFTTNAVVRARAAGVKHSV